MSAVKTGRLLFCAPLPPEYDRESGSRRIYHLVELARSAGWDTAFVCENAPADSPHVRHLRQLGIPTYVGFGDHTKSLLRAGGFDVVVFAFWYLADRYVDLVRTLSPGTRVVVETVDLHWLRNARRVLSGRDEASGLLAPSFGGEFVGELNAYARADGVLTVSEKEAALVNDIVGDSGLAHAVPDFDEIATVPRTARERSGIVFIGNFRHPPNLDAVEYLCGEVMPLISPELRRAHPLSIVGNGPGARVHELAASCPGARVVGWVPSVEPYLHAARIAVVPLRYGAGTKRKLIQSLLAGTPTVTSPAGVEGIDVQDEEHLLVADDARTFAAAIERLLGDRRLWSAISERGRARMLELHGRDAARARLRQALTAILARPARDGSAEPERTPREEDGVAAVRRAMSAVLPQGANVLVVSRGDPTLLDVPGRDASHFPQDPDGEYAGHHPRDSAEALARLHDLRDRADYLVFPSTSFWWLDHYAGLAHHLRQRCERVWAGDECVIYRLPTEANEPLPDLPRLRAIP